MQIWMCEDDETLWESQREAFEDRFPKATIKFFLNAGYAAHETGSPDFIIIDVGGVMAGVDTISLCRYNVEGLSNLYPGAIFIVTSAIGVLAEDVYDELKPEIHAVSDFVPSYGIEKICDKIDEWLKKYE